MNKKFTKLMAAFALLVCFFVPLGMKAQPQSIVITQSSAGISGNSYSDGSFTLNGISFGYNQWLKSSSNIQASKNTTNSCYNSTAIPGTITSIVVVQTGTARAITIYGGTSEKPTTQITSPTTNATMTFDFTGNTYNYFSLKTPNNACYFASITINYVSGPSITNLSYTGTPTTTTYEDGDHFDPTGLTVTATFSDNTTEDVTSSVTWTPDPLTQGTTSVTGTYSGLTVTVPGITVTAPAGPDIVLNYNNSPFTATSANSNTATVTLDGIEYSSYGGYNYTNSSGSYLSISRDVEGYLGNNTQLYGNIKKIVVDYATGGASLFTMYEGAAALLETTTVSPSGNGTGAITYTFSGNNGYFKFKRTTTGTNYSDYSNINSISIYLKDSNNPAITVSPSSLSFTYVYGTDENDLPIDNITVNGSNLTQDITVALPSESDFELSYDLTNWGNSTTLTPANGSLANAEVAVRLKEGKAVGTYTGSLSVNSSEVNEVTVSLSGTVIPPTHELALYSSNLNGTITFTPSSPISEGETVTLTATPNEGYDFGGWTFYKEGDEDFEVDNSIMVNANNQFTMPQYDLWVDATFTAKPNHNVTIASGIENGTVTANPTSAYAGQTITLTVTPGTNCYLTSLAATYVDDNEAIQQLTISDNNTFVMPNYNVTVTATFASNIYEGSFAKYSGNLTEGDYLIVYDNSAMNTTLSSSRLGYTAVEPSNDNIITNPSRVIVWHIAQDGDYWTIYNAKENKYASNSSYNNSNMALVPSTSNNNGAVWQASGTETYEFRSKGNAVSYPDNARYLRKNGTYGFASYASSTGGALTLYKKIPNVAPAWIPEFPTNAEIITGTPYELTVSDFVTGIPTPSISITTSVSSSLYEFEDGEFMFQPNEAGTFEFTFTATNTEGSAPVTLTITVNAPAQLQYFYSSNGTLGAPQSITQGQSINSLAAGANLNADFVFVGWTTDPSDVEHILEAGSSYTVNEATTFYAVYSRTVNVAKEKVVVLDGDAPELTSTAHALTLSENGFTYYASSAKYQVLGSGAENNVSSGKTILIGKQGAYLYNTTAFDQGITKFEIYANAGAAAGVSVGVNFSASTISEYNAAAENTWTATLSTRDYVYDASEALPQGAKYFWYQVTNANNSQVQFRITYTATESATTYYTRVFLNETASAIITIAGPSIIPSGSMLDMGEYTLSNDDPANLIIEDGGQLYTDDVVEATIKKNISAASNWGPQDPDNPYTPNGWYLISSPLNCDEFGINPATATTEVKNMTTGDYDLYLFDPNADKEWVNFKGANGNFGLINGHGYLYANASNITLEFAGSLNCFNAEYFSSLEDGYNLIGNPYVYNAYPSMNYYKMNDERTGIEATETANTNYVEPCTGIIVEKGEDGPTSFSFSKTVPTGGAKGGIHVALAETKRGAARLDNAIVSFNEGSQLGKFYFGTQNANLYIPQGNKEYAIVSSEAQGEMPVNFRANENGQYTLTVNPENVEMNYLHLIDNMTGADIDLLQTPSYTFNANVTDYESRFKLVFATNNEDGASTGSATFAFYSNGNWIINNAGEATLQVVDITGRILSSETVNGSVNKAINATPGVYMLRLINGENVKVQKIVVR